MYVYIYVYQRVAKRTLWPPKQQVGRSIRLWAIDMNKSGDGTKP